MLPRIVDQLAAIKVFVAVADAGSLSAAGRRLAMPLTTVSRQLAALEELVGVRLITRTTRELALTETGRHYLESCRRILAELDAARLRVAGAQDEPQGELAVTAPVAFGRLHVLPIVTAFLKSAPLVTARMLLIDRVVDLIEEGIDISLRIGALPDSSLRATRVGSIRLITCASPAYLAERGEPASPGELAAHDCIAVTALSPPDRLVYPGAKAPQRIAVRPRLIVNTAEAAVDAAKAGLGIVRVLSYQAEAGLADGSLRVILEGFEPEPIPVNLVHREDRLPQAKVQSFIAFAAPRLKQALKERVPPRGGTRSKR
jgi:DNA-binding transcriptional LysR family regulator